MRRVIQAVKKVLPFVLFVSAVVLVLWLILREPDASYPLADAQPEPLLSTWEPLP